MGMSIKQLRAFLAVAHTLNFAHASERLNMSQPALSLAIKGLEDSLGGALLLRTTRKVTLTQEGETLLNMGRQLLADWENTEEAMRQRFTLLHFEEDGRFLQPATQVHRHQPKHATQQERDTPAVVMHRLLRQAGVHQRRNH